MTELAVFEAGSRSRVRSSWTTSGAEKKSEWVDETLGLVINTRYSERRLTVITTNLRDLDSTEPGSFAFHLGLRTRSRLKEMCDWMPIEGVDTRDVGRYPTPEDIAKWQERSPGLAQEPARLIAAAQGHQPGEGSAPEARERRKADLKWPGGRAGSR